VTIGFLSGKMKMSKNVVWGNEEEDEDTKSVKV
jgi:hypothetical protein